MNNHRLLPLALVLAATLAGCGGNDDGRVTEPAANEVPSSATASSAAYSEYAGSLAPSDNTEPLSVDKVVPPVSDTEAPIEVA
jgi:hypothetical protein